MLKGSSVTSSVETSGNMVQTLGCGHANAWEEPGCGWTRTVSHCITGGTRQRRHDMPRAITPPKSIASYRTPHKNVALGLPSIRSGKGSHRNTAREHARARSGFMPRGIAPPAAISRAAVSSHPQWSAIADAARFQRLVSASRATTVGRFIDHGRPKIDAAAARAIAGFAKAGDIKGRAQPTLRRHCSAGYAESRTSVAFRQLVYATRPRSRPRPRRRRLGLRQKLRRLHRCARRLPSGKRWTWPHNGREPPPRQQKIQRRALLKGCRRATVWKKRRLLPHRPRSQHPHRRPAGEALSKSQRGGRHRPLHL